MPNCEVISADSFERALRKLSKRYRSLKQDLLKLIDVLEEHPETGTPLGGGVFKIRLAIQSKGKGKRGGGRVITYYQHRNVVYLLTIYDKGEQDDISDVAIASLIHELRLKHSV